MMQFLMDILNGAENAAIIAGLIIGMNLWNKSIDYAKENTENEKVKRCLTEIDDAMEEAVDKVNQTLVNGLKAIGGFDGIAQEAARIEAKETFLGILSDEAREYLYRAYTDIDALIRAKTEHAVVKAKKKKKGAVLVSEGILLEEVAEAENAK